MGFAMSEAPEETPCSTLSQNPCGWDVINVTIITIITITISFITIVLTITITFIVIFITIINETPASGWTPLPQVGRTLPGMLAVGRLPEPSRSAPRGHSTGVSAPVSSPQSEILREGDQPSSGAQDRAAVRGDPSPGSIALKMSFLEENTGVEMDSAGRERAEPPCSSEAPAGGPLEPGPSVTSFSPTHAEMVTTIPEKFSMYDQDQKVVVLDCGTLTAVPNKHYILPETFSVLASRLCSAYEEKGSPVLLAVSNGELCLCCEEDNSKSYPSLQLKKQSLEYVAAQEEAQRLPFTFYRAVVGSRNTLESAAHTGWFLCTSFNAGEPVEMTDSLGGNKYTEFSFEHVGKAAVSPSKAFPPSVMK
ncbi:interleukin-37 [Rhinolophus sinicus]|uniref:interleukin-37 n=1 Tax=Rhinolophus sinicus TaxID=89399 RepID=UPI003D7B787E